ncbi:hypothetical protein [Thermococcus sp.]
MKLLRILIPFFAFVWELIPLFKIPVGYYIKGGMVWFENWTGSAGRPYVCWGKYSPSPIFIVLVLLPALVLLVSYIFHRDSSLRNLGLSMLFSLLAATIAPVFMLDLSINSILLMLVSLSSGIALGKDIGDRAILAFGGFLPGLVVILVISAQFHGAC